MYVPHVSIHLSVDKHLHCFPFLVIMNDAALNIHVQVYVHDIHFQFSCVRMELLSHVVTLGLRIASFPKWLYHFTIPPAIDERFSFSTSWPISVTVFFILAILLGVKWYLIVIYYDFLNYCMRS